MRRRLSALPSGTAFDGGTSFSGVVLAQRPAEEKTIVWISEVGAPPRVGFWSDRVWVNVLSRAKYPAPAEIVERWRNRG